MKQNKTYFYIALFVILLVAAYFITTDRGEKTASYNIDQVNLIDSDSASIDKIEIRNEIENIVLVKSGGEWRLSEPVDARANTQFVEMALSNLGKMKLESIVSTNPEKNINYGFTPGNEATISVYQNGEPKGTFIIGNAGPGGNQSYVKRTDNNNVYLASNITKSNFVKMSTEDWRDKSISKIPQESVNSVEFISGAESFIAERDTTGNFVIGGEQVGSAFNTILNSLQNFNTQYFKDTTLAGDTNFDYRLIVNWGPVTEFKFVKMSGEPVQYMLQVSDEKQIYVLDEGFAQNVIKTKSELLSN
jgi:hypothetical protein